MFGQENLVTGQAVIKVLGVGGGGCNAINSMIDCNITAAEFIAVNTDKQALRLSKTDKLLPIGENATKGLGAGSNPAMGEIAAEESKEKIIEILEGTDLLFIAAGMGGGTGTGAAPVIARLARDMGILTVAVVTRPFSFEGKVRNENANQGIANLRKYVDTLVVIPNDKLLQFLPKNIGMLDAFKVADDMLKQGIVGIVDIIATPSLVNLDFADIKMVMSNQGMAHMGIGTAKGEGRVVEAVKQAISSPLLETTIEGAKAVILNITAGKDLGLNEVSEAATLIQQVIDPSAHVIYGQTIDDNMNEELKITVIATGFAAQQTGIASATAAKPLNVFESQADESNVPPLLRTIESEERRAQETQQPAQNLSTLSNLSNVAQPQRVEPTTVEPTAVVKPVVEEVKPIEPAAAPTEAPAEAPRGRELPAFMKRLFGKK